MEKDYIYRYVPLAALFATLGIIFPIFFHFLGLGSAFLPMFIPVIMGATLLPPSMAVAIAVITPLMSFLFTGMPPVYPPILLIVLLELVVVSLISSVLYGRKKFSIWLTLLVAVAIDRFMLYVFIRFFSRQLGFPEQFYSVAAVAYGIPGIILIFTIIPLSLRFFKLKYPQLLQVK